jgi:hypothetical protein
MTNDTAEAGPTQTTHDRRAGRRAARRAQSTSEILDAAEKVFGARGLSDGSLREVADEAGFSTGALYLFFENKQHLIGLDRRGRGSTPCWGGRRRAAHLSTRCTTSSTRPASSSRPDPTFACSATSRGGATIIGPRRRVRHEANAGFAESRHSRRSW